MAGFFSKLVKIMSSKKYSKNPEESVLTSAQQRALNIGAINAEQTMYYCDSLETGCDKNEIRENLSNYYGIDDRESALETLSWLSNRGHRVYYEAIKQFSSGIASSIDDSILQEEEKPNTYEYINHLKETFDVLRKKGYIYDKADFNTCSIVGWDMGRLVLVTRCCYECEYITKEEAWSYINFAYKECQASYNDWKEFATGYIIGRCMWGGENMALGGIMEIANDLVHDEESPWSKVPLT